MPSCFQGPLVCSSTQHRRSDSAAERSACGPAWRVRAPHCPGPSPPRPPAWALRVARSKDCSPLHAHICPDCESQGLPSPQHMQEARLSLTSNLGLLLWNVAVSGELQGPRGCCPESALELGLASQVACHPVTSSARIVVRSSDSKAGSLGLLLHSGGAVGARPRRALSC